MDLISLTLQVTVGDHIWQPMDFDGESAAWVDLCAATFVSRMADSVGVAIDETTDWSQFPLTFARLAERAYAPAELALV